MGLVLPLILIFICGYVIWRAGDTFLEGSNYIGRNLQDGVKGATINAVASSMPELFIALFFLFYLKDVSGFSGGLGTSFGSVLFNSLIIPSVAVLGVLSKSKKKTVVVSKKIIIRDGLWLLLVEFVLIYFIQQGVISWVESLVLMIIYSLYLLYLFKTMKGGHEINYEEPFSDKEKVSFLSAFMILDLKRMIIGNQKLNTGKAWLVFVVSSLIIGFVCYFLVIACEWLGSETYTVYWFGELKGLGIPLLFVAIIFAAIGSSFPDTIISYKDAQKGNYDDAISNAYGSNIFNLCVALGIPLFFFTFIYGPIELTPEIVSLISSLSWWFFGLTIFSIFLYTRDGGVTKKQAFILILSYFIFIIFIFWKAYNTVVVL
jgi:cation:H+ antiporter